MIRVTRVNPGWLRINGAGYGSWALWDARWKRAGLGNFLAARAKGIEKGGASWAGTGKKEKLSRLTGHAK
jgi:hypothetical protein